MTTVVQPADLPAAQKPEEKQLVIATQETLQRLATSVVCLGSESDSAAQELKALVGPIGSTNFRLLTAFFHAIENRGFRLEHIPALSAQLAAWHWEATNPVFDENRFAQECRRQLDLAFPAEPEPEPELPGGSMAFFALEPESPAIRVSPGLTAPAA